VKNQKKVWKIKSMPQSLWDFLYLCWDEPYNQQLPQSALGSKSPLQAMKDWHKTRPELFKKQPYYWPGCDN
jgi:hypothetical protein